MVNRALGLGLTTSVTRWAAAQGRRLAPDTMDLRRRCSYRRATLPAPGWSNEATAVASARSVSVTLPL